MPVIVISGQPGAGSTTIGTMLAKKLKISFFSPGNYFKSHSSAGNETDKMLDFWSTEEGKSEQLHRKLDDMQRFLAEKGNIVIVGKLSIHMIKKADLKVWLKAPLDLRARRTAKRDSMSMEETKRKMKNREQEERKRWKEIYGFDYFQQEKKADLVIDVSKKTPEQIVNKIIHAGKF
ncbi:MAG: cytidylate kinase family protein [Candidatus Aenigmarchaeota archaeon]|nr:cytidylate kinase family protein [Candidatus Aenigmarchaeota archaeon]